MVANVMALDKLQIVIPLSVQGKTFISKFGHFECDQQKNEAVLLHLFMV